MPVYSGLYSKLITMLVYILLAVYLICLYFAYKGAAEMEDQ
jgi:heme/copper-type cytochrome/quinol oxidase subunit 2